MGPDKEALYRIEPGGESRGEVEGPAKVAQQSGQHLGMLVRGIVVEHRVYPLPGWDFAFDGIEEADELAVTVALHSAPDHHPTEHAEGSEQGGGAVAFIVMRRGLAAPGLDR